MVRTIFLNYKRAQTPVKKQCVYKLGREIIKLE